VLSTTVIYVETFHFLTESVVPPHTVPRFLFHSSDCRGPRTWMPQKRRKMSPLFRACLTCSRHICIS